MLNINLLSSLADLYMSQSDTIDKKDSTETALIAINECIGSLVELKEILKSSNKMNIANILSICLSISEQTKEIKEVNHQLKKHL